VRSAVLPVLAVAFAAGCAAPPAPRVAPPPPTPSAAPTPAPTPTPAPRLAPLPSPSLTVSLAVDRASAALPAGDWILASGERAERRRGPLLFVASSSGLRVTDDGAASDWPASVEIAPASGSLVTWGDATYRGRLVVRATPRGTIHLLDHVGLEDYLKGVVPTEMGPRVYDEVEALKAQAVAARSYAVKHRGQFAAEGYDLCTTARCQVYSGASAENPLSTRAVEETAGEVLLWKGAVADALFTSTCGGRTESAADVMPGYAGVDAPYLASVPCFGETLQTLDGAAPPARKGTLTLLGARGRALAASLGGGEGPKIAQKAREALQQRLGLAAHGASRPHPLSVPAVYLEIASAAGFDTAVLSEESERGELPSSWSEKAKAAFAALQRFQLGGGTALPTDRALRPEEVAGIYAVLLSRLGDFEDVEGRITKRDETDIEVKSAKGRASYSLSEEIVLFEGGNEALAQRQSHAFFPGDKVRVFVRDGKACGIVFPPQPAAGAYDRESVWEHWTRRFTAAELGAKLRERDATRGAADPTGVAVTSRGASGRARTVAVTTPRGVVTLTGLEIRFALGLPESLFSVVSGTDEGGGRVFTFYGRGWGHGVGLCQTGAFGMALAGRSYREILAHYYPGTEVGPAPLGRERMEAP